MRRIITAVIAALLMVLFFSPPTGGREGLGPIATPPITPIAIPDTATRTP